MFRTHMCLQKILKEMMRTLKAGVLSISLPTDPGIIWRLGRKFIKYFTLKLESQVMNLST